MLKILTKKDKELLQRRGYIYEHLLCLYSVVSDTTALYEGAFPVFLNNYGEADVVLFSLGSEKTNRLKCVQNLIQLNISKLNIVSPKAFVGLPGLRTRYADWDFHINVNEFDLDLRGSKYRNIRYTLRKVEGMNYSTKLDRKFTSQHTYILSRHLVRHKLQAWDYEELLSLDRFFREHDHGVMMEVYKNDILVGFDVIDFFEDNRIMVVPLGIYLQNPFVSDFMMYENIKFAKNEGYEWLSVGPTCGLAGLRRFKEKWLAKPKFKLYVQEIHVKSTEGNRMSSL